MATMPLSRDSPIKTVNDSPNSPKDTRKKSVPKKAKAATWKPTDVERHPNCFTDMLIDRPIIWIFTNLVMLVLVGHLVFSKDWINLTEENRKNYFIKDNEIVQDYYKSVLVERNLLENGLMSMEYP